MLLCFDICAVILQTINIDSCVVNQYIIFCWVPLRRQYNLMQMEIDTPQSCLPFEMKLILGSAQTTVLVD